MVDGGRWTLNASTKTQLIFIWARACTPQVVYFDEAKNQNYRIYFPIGVCSTRRRDVPRNKLQFVIIILWIFVWSIRRKNCLEMTKIGWNGFSTKSQYFPFRKEECTTLLLLPLQVYMWPFVWRLLPFLLFSFKLVLIVGHVAHCSHAAKINK